MLYRKIKIAQKGAFPVSEAVLFGSDQNILMVFQRHNFQIRRILDVLKQPFFFFDFSLDSLFHLLCPALHFLCLCADIRSCSHPSVMIFYRVVADFGAFVLVGPVPCPFGCFFQFTDFLPVFLILRYLKGVLTLFIFPPGRKITLLYLEGDAVQHQNMVHAGIQQVPVVGNQQKSFFLTQVFLDNFSGSLVQMVCRLVDEQEIIFSGKKNRKHDSRALPMAERSKGAVKQLRIHLHFIKLHDDPPFLAVRRKFIQEIRHTFRKPLFFNLKGKIIKRHGSLNTPLIFIFSKQQIQKSRLSLAVPSNKSQFPIGIYAKRYLFKNIFKTALIAEGQIRHTYFRHKNPAFPFGAGRTLHAFRFGTHSNTKAGFFIFR